MKLSEHFTLEELIYSETAIRKDLDNTPSEDIKQNLILLCEKVLEPLRTIINIPIKINSGYRSIEVNKEVGGVSTSQHCKGEAADTVAIGIPVKDYYTKVKQLVKDKQLIIDQCIYEYESWVHISYKSKGTNRNQFLIKSKNTGYIPDNI